MAIPAGGYLEAQISLLEMLVRPSSNDRQSRLFEIVQVGPEALGFRPVEYGASGCPLEFQEFSPNFRRGTSALAELGVIALAPRALASYRTLSIICEDLPTLGLHREGRV